MSDSDRLYQLRHAVELAYWRLDATDHDTANSIYDHFGIWFTLTREQAESALAMFNAALDTTTRNVLE